jgi:6-phosphogluconolactonase
MARAALLDHILIPSGNVHRMRGELPPAQAAAAYESELEATLGTEGAFDLILLGVGTDGHTASLFPDTPALEEQTRWVIENYVDKLKRCRITLTLPVINAARMVIILVSGAAKAEVLALVQDGSPLPIGCVQPSPGQLIWLVDRAAAAMLRA